MKQFYAIVFLILTIYAPDVLGQVRAGVKAGANISTVQFQNEFFQENINAKIGYYAGVFAEYDLGLLVFARQELQYVSKGYGYIPGSNYESGTVSLNYLTFPILFGYKVNEQLSVVAGPEVSLLLNAVSRTEGVKTKMSDIYRAIDIGAELGLSYKFTEKLAGEIRYTHGFRGLVRAEFTDASGIPIGDIKDGRNRVFQFGFSYLLHEK